MNLLWNTYDRIRQVISFAQTIFTILDDKGIYYKFNAYELSEVMMTEEMNSYGFPWFTMKVLNTTKMDGHMHKHPTLELVGLKGQKCLQRTAINFLQLRERLNLEMWFYNQVLL